jgi:Domain of unknown function (DU1801)
MKIPKITNQKVADVFKAYPSDIRTKLMFLRELIFQTAASLPIVGELEETLKWGEPSYLTPQTKSGSTIRIDWKKKNKEQFAMFFKCTANLVPAMKEKYPEKLKFEGNRSIIFTIDEKIPTNEIKQCIALALTYHRNKKLKPSERWAMIEKNT